MSDETETTILNRAVYLVEEILTQTGGLREAVLDAGKVFTKAGQIISAMEAEKKANTVLH